MLGINVMIGASVFGIIAALLIGFVAANSKIKTDTSIGVVFSAFYALGFILISMAESATNLHHILFGNIFSRQRQRHCHHRCRVGNCDPVRGSVL